MRFLPSNEPWWSAESIKPRSPLIFAFCSFCYCGFSSFARIETAAPLELQTSHWVISGSSTLLSKQIRFGTCHKSTSVNRLLTDVRSNWWGILSGVLNVLMLFLLITLILITFKLEDLYFHLDYFGLRLVHFKCFFHYCLPEDCRLVPSWRFFPQQDLTCTAVVCLCTVAQCLSPAPPLPSPSPSPPCLRCSNTPDSNELIVSRLIWIRCVAARRHWTHARRWLCSTVDQWFSKGGLGTPQGSLRGRQGVPG